jgi:hypothetical protein
MCGRILETKNFIKDRPPGRSSQERISVMTKRSKNAITHGVYAEEVVLPWEDAQAFDKLHQDVRRDLKPSGYLQRAKSV